MSATTTVPIYLRVSKTLSDRLNNFRNENQRPDQDPLETLLRVGLLVLAMPDGSVITRKRGAMLGLDTEPKTITIRGEVVDDDIEF